DLSVRDRAGGDSGHRRLGARLDLVKARPRAAADRLSRPVGTMAAGFRGGAKRAPGAVLSNRQRAADLGDDRDCHPCGGQAVLTTARGCDEPTPCKSCLTCISGFCKGTANRQPVFLQSFPAISNLLACRTPSAPGTPGRASPPLSRR